MNKELKEDKELCKEAITQLEQYFQGERKKFTLPLSMQGTFFRKQVWKALIDIPYGEIKSYVEVAEIIGNPKAIRAVGQANKANRIPIIIPCHRVIGKSGKLVGFAGNRTYKQKLLLEHEGFIFDNEGRIQKQNIDSK